MTESLTCKLFKSYLDEKQLHDWKKYGHIWVVTQGRYLYQIRDGQSIVHWTSQGQATSYHVWAANSLGEPQDLYTSLLTQLLFLTSSRPRDILDIACHGGRHWHDARGIPKMRGNYVDEENGVTPVVY